MVAFQDYLEPDSERMCEVYPDPKRQLCIDMTRSAHLWNAEDRIFSIYALSSTSELSIKQAMKRNPDDLSLPRNDRSTCKFRNELT